MGEVAYARAAAYRNVSLTSYAMGRHNGPVASSQSPPAIGGEKPCRPRISPASSAAQSGRRVVGPSRDAFLVRLAARPEIAAAILLAVMSAFLFVATPTFATHENLIWVCYSFSVIGIATIGMLLVFAAGDIDFSIGAEIGLAAVIAGRIVFYHPGTPDVVVFAAMIATGLAFGLVNGTHRREAQVQPVHCNAGHRLHRPRADHHRFGESEPQRLLRQPHRTG